MEHLVRNPQTREAHTMGRQHNLFAFFVFVGNGDDGKSGLPRFRRSIGFISANLPHEVEASPHSSGATCTAKRSAGLCSATAFPASEARVNIHNHKASARSLRRRVKRRKASANRQSCTATRSSISVRYSAAARYFLG